MYRLVLSLLIMLLVAVFAVQNKDVINVAFLAWVFPVPSVLLVLGSATLGAVLTGLLSTFKQLGLNRELRSYQHKVKKLEEALAKQAEPGKPAGPDGAPAGKAAGE